jgi:hypothetical protein
VLPNPRTYVSSKGYSFTKGQTGKRLVNECYIIETCLEGTKLHTLSIAVCRDIVHKDYTAETKG